MKSLVVRPSFKCGICGRRQPAEDIVRSEFTGRYYCIDSFKCARRAKKAARNDN